MHWNLFKSCTILLGSLLLSLYQAPVMAQDKDILYVTDKLRLSMYESASDSSRVVKLLVSGDQLAVDELSGLYALVTADDGTKGWVKRGFLVAEPTANLQLAMELEKNEQLQEEVDRLGSAKQVIDQYEQDMDALNEKSITMEQEKSSLQTRIAELEQEIGNQQAEIDELKTDDGVDPQLIIDIARQYWQLLVAILAAVVLLIFILSKIIVEARIKSRFQGIKVW